MLDADLYLPSSWDEDRKRCEKSGIPREIVYRPKWMIALDQYWLASRNGLVFDWLTFDEGYGSKPLFMSILAIWKQKFAGEIPKSFAVDGPGGQSC